MAVRTLRRKVIIREYDFERVKREAFAPTGIHTLYDRVSFMPLNQEAIEKLKVVDILKGKNHTPILETKWNTKIPGLLLRDLKDYLYDERYAMWRVTIDLDGYLCVQARKNTPLSRIGWGVFEKDLISRL
jgi:hypothetical protein